MMGSDFARIGSGTNSSSSYSILVMLYFRRSQEAQARVGAPESGIAWYWQEMVRK
jgi:hypothetical protein